MSTIHNPVNFVPTDYEAVDYLDNKPPVYMPGMSIEWFMESRTQFHHEFADYFGWRTETIAKIPHHCEHCGHALRYVVVVFHKPTQTHVCFGQDCVKRLGMTYDEFQFLTMKKMTSKREELSKTQGKNFLDFANEYPEAAKALLSAKDNPFLQSLYDKVRKGFALSEKQLDCINNQEKYKQRQEARALQDLARRQAQPIEEGRYFVEGRVISVKEVEDYDEYTIKLLIERPDLTRVYGTCPKKLREETDGELKGAYIRLNATIKRSNRDDWFGFFSRPTKASVLLPNAD